MRRCSLLPPQAVTDTSPLRPVCNERRPTYPSPDQPPPTACLPLHRTRPYRVVWTEREHNYDSLIQLVAEKGYTKMGMWKCWPSKDQVSFWIYILMGLLASSCMCNRITDPKLDQDESKEGNSINPLSMWLSMKNVVYTWNWLKYDIHSYHQRCDMHKSILTLSKCSATLSLARFITTAKTVPEGYEPRWWIVAKVLMESFSGL